MTAPLQSLELLELAGGRWTVPVLISLQGGTLRFGQIQRALGGISHKQLSQTLRRLERDGFVLRTAYASIPPRVEYQLSDLGAAFASLLFEIGRFEVDRGNEIGAARQRFDEAIAFCGPEIGVMSA